jgi:hypothetical protein
MRVTQWALARPKQAAFASAGNTSVRISWEHWHAAIAAGHMLLIQGPSFPLRGLAEACEASMQQQCEDLMGKQRCRWTRIGTGHGSQQKFPGKKGGRCASRS